MEELNVIKTLVSIELDLVSSLAIRFACQLGSLVDAEIHPVYVKESSPHDSVVGAGWASRTWEKEMVEQGKAEIAELITAEMDFCPVLKEPRVIYGDREAELLGLAQAEGFQIYVEGAHFPWTSHDLYKKLHTKLFRNITSPVILVKTLRKINQVQLLCLDVAGTQTLAHLFGSVWKDCPVPLMLSYPGPGVGEGLKKAVEEARQFLTESGCAVSAQETLFATPEAQASEELRDCGLVAIAVERSAKKDSKELRLLESVKTSALLAFR
jgi:nucleotide-binding universal stress UspA family protein